MHPGRLVYALLAGGLLVLGVAVAAFALGIGGPSLGDDPSVLPGSPALVSVESTGGTCVESAALDVSAERRPDGETTSLTVSANVTVPATTDALDRPTFERTGPTSYALNVTSSEATAKSPRECDGVAQAQYTAVLRVPHADREAFAVVVRHDGDVVYEIRNGEDGSGAGYESGSSAGNDG